jgi:hypothetical protein
MENQMSIELYEKLMDMVEILSNMENELIDMYNKGKLPNENISDSIETIQHIYTLTNKN